MNQTQMELLEGLTQIPKLSPSISEAQRAEYTASIRQQLLAYGSETPDNLNCAEHIEIGPAKSPGMEKVFVGLRLAGQTIFVSDIMNVVESIDIPDEVKEYYPELSENEWSACLRLVTLVLSVLEGKS